MAANQGQSAPLGTTGAVEAYVSFTGNVPDPDVGKDTNETDIATYFRMRSKWVYDERILAGTIAKAPSASGNDTEFIRVASETARLAVEWQSWRKGMRAQLPLPYLSDGNSIVLGQETDLDNVEIEGDDVPIFISAGTIFYGFLQRKQTTLSYPMPTYITLPDPSIVIVDPIDFVPGILNDMWPNPKAQTIVTQP